MKRITAAVVVFSLLVLLTCKLNSKVIVIAAREDKINTEPIVSATTTPVEHTENISISAIQKNSDGCFYIREIPLSRELQEYSYNLCNKKNISYDLLLAVMKKESNFNMDIVSYNDNGSYDSGLMQINSCNLENIREIYGVTNLLDPYDNVKIGIDMISAKINEFGERGGLIAYNMGNKGYQNAMEAGTLSTPYYEKVMQYKAEITEFEKT